MLFATYLGMKEIIFGEEEMKKMGQDFTLIFRYLDFKICFKTGLLSVFVMSYTFTKHIRIPLSCFYLLN